MASARILLVPRDVGDALRAMLRADPSADPAAAQRRAAALAAALPPDAADISPARLRGTLEPDAKCSSWDTVQLANRSQLAALRHYAASIVTRAQRGLKRYRELNYLTPRIRRLDGQPVPLSAAGDDGRSGCAVLLDVALYDPVTGRKSEEFLVLATQPLTALRDCIYCQRRTAAGAVRDDDGDDDDGSAFFFIENAFYTDMRKAGARDLSEPIKAWADERRRTGDPTLPVYLSKPMTEHRFSDVAICPGQPYLYCHRVRNARAIAVLRRRDMTGPCAAVRSAAQDACEHIVVFRDIRLAHPRDEQDARLYPLRVFQAKVRRKKCVVCNAYLAKYETHNDRLATRSPCYFCERCYRLLHFAADGTLLSQHEAVPYYHGTACMRGRYRAAGQFTRCP